MKTFPLILCLFLASTGHASDTFTTETNLGGLVREFMLSAPSGSHRPVLGAHRYAIVKRSALAEVTATVRRTISKAYGVPVSIVTQSSGWNPRWDCEAFAMAYALELRARMMRELFHSDSKATRPACFIVDHETSPTTSHAILFILTDEGAVWVDPVVGVVPGPQGRIFFNNL